MSYSVSRKMHGVAPQIDGTTASAHLLCTTLFSFPLLARLEQCLEFILLVFILGLRRITTPLLPLPLPLLVTVAGKYVVVTTCKSRND
jgi:hypothetical protein